ncbi:MAG: SDR family oxidoreductase [Spirochaetota bacterium]|jgi:NAD(P)-dependent dehydrogenase (short-subunit alcohol dehydrogenase family)|nr:SDR family oxidoreductase [Spirochaetota bacterium]
MPKAVITGASGKLGRVFALTLAKNGYSLVLHCHTNREALLPLKEELARMRCAVTIAVCDLAQPDDRMAFARACFDAETEVLINSAACFSRETMAETSADDAVGVFALNTFAPYDLCRSFAALRARLSPGLAVNILDSKIFLNASRYAAYTLSKKSLADITRLAACEFAPQLRVNAIAPGCLFPEGASWTERAPLGNAGTVEDIGYALEFFLRAKSVTGQILCVDGGLSLG